MESPSEPDFVSLVAVRQSGSQAPALICYIVPMPSPKSRRRSSDQPTLAAQADRYALYLKAVQAPEFEVRLLDRMYRKVFNRPARVLREDFCGTFAVCCEWARSGPERLAIGVDIDPKPLTWGREHNLARIKPEQQSRVRLLQQDVRRINSPKADIVAAENFSYWIFKTRTELLRYFKAAYRNIADEGIMVVDLVGGSDMWKEEQEDVTRHRGFKYVWREQRIDPITHDCTFHIHFRFKDGSELKRAFEYHWRLWTVPEVRDLLAEAGFAATTVYWEGTERATGKGNSIFRPCRSAPAERSWIGYIVAQKRR